MYFIYVFYLKSSPPFPTHLAWICAHPTCVQNKNKNKKFTTVEECSSTCPSLCPHEYGGPTGCPLVEL